MLKKVKKDRTRLSLETSSSIPRAAAYPEPSQASKMDLFAKIVNCVRKYVSLLNSFQMLFT